jgi:ActR/RegA family two-component response regulator
VREAPLHGCRLLVVEDDYLIAQDMRRSLEREGAVVVGPVPSVEKALSLIGSDPALRAAVVDVNLNGEKSFAVASALEQRRIPFIFATGYNAADIPPEWSHVVRLEKPVEVAAVATALSGWC